MPSSIWAWMLAGLLGLASSAAGATWVVDGVLADVPGGGGTPAAGVLTTDDVESELSGDAGRLPDSSAVVGALADVLRQGDVGTAVLAPDGDGSQLSGLPGALPDGDSQTEQDHLVWDDVQGAWTAGQIVPRGDQAGQVLVWDVGLGKWVQGSEADPVVGAVLGLVKADGAGVISEASPGMDYLAPDGDGSMLTGVLPSGTMDGEALVWFMGAWQPTALLPTGDSTSPHLVWDGFGWVAGNLSLPDGDSITPHLVWDGFGWTAGRVIPDGDNMGNDHLIWSDGIGWLAGPLIDASITGMLKGDGAGGIAAAVPYEDFLKARYVRWVAANDTDAETGANWEGGRVPGPAEFAWHTSEYGVTATPNGGGVNSLVLSGSVDWFATANGLVLLYDNASNYGTLNGVVALMPNSATVGTVKGVTYAAAGTTVGGYLHGLLVAEQAGDIDPGLSLQGVSIYVDTQTVALNGFGIPDLAVVDADDPSVINAGVYMPDAGIGGGIVTNAALYTAWLTAFIQDVVAGP